MWVPGKREKSLPGSPFVTSNRAHEVARRKIGTAEKATVERISAGWRGHPWVPNQQPCGAEIMRRRSGPIPARGVSGEADYNLNKAASLGAPFGAILTKPDAPFCIQAVHELNFLMDSRDFESRVSRAISWRSWGDRDFGAILGARPASKIEICSVSFRWGAACGRFPV